MDGSLTILAITHRPAWLEVADRIYEVAANGVSLVTESAPRLTAVPLRP